MHPRPNQHAPLRDALLTSLAARQKEMAAMLSELVRIPTENPPGNHYQQCADFLERRLVQSGLDCRRYAYSAPTATQLDRSAVSLIATYGSGRRTLHFHGHYDVVPAQSGEQFQPQQRGDFVFGRGSGDMKGGIVAMLFAIRALQDCHIELNGKIALTLVPDEETGGARGSAWLAEHGVLGQHGIGMLLAEPTSGVVWNANRGAISLRIIVHGKSAHVGLQHRGENAFDGMLHVAQRLQSLKAEVERHETSCKIGAEQSRKSILMLGGASGGGANFNVVPEHCWFTLDRRINPEEDLAAEKRRIIDVLEDCRREGIRLDWEIFQEGNSSLCSENEPLAQALAASIQSVTDETPRFEMCPGLLELRFYAARNIPAYAYGPGLLSVAHGPNEYVDMRKVRDCAAIYGLTAIEILSSSATPG